MKLKIAWRNIRKTPYIHALNVSGLAIGIASFLFLLTYVRVEYSYDDFHQDIDQLYRINHVIKQEGKEPYIGAATFAGVGPALVSEYDNVVSSCRLEQAYNGVVARYENKSPIEHDQVFYAESSFFDLFSFTLIQGDRSTVLSHLHTAVLSKELALMHFGTIDCLGKNLTIHSINGTNNYEVVGVFDNSQATHLEINMLLSFPSLLQAWGPGTDTNWRWFDFITYIKVAPGTDPNWLEELFPTFINKYGGARNNSKKLDFDIIPVKDIHLTSNINQEIAQNGNLDVVRFLMIVGVFIILIAWINYINLYTAKASDRSKEIGVRKALGSSKKDIVIQFLVETGLLNAMAFVFGILLFFGIKHIAPLYLGIDLYLSSRILLEGILLIIPFFILSIAVSGIYPSMMIAGLKTLGALKNSQNLIGSSRLRKGLIIFQFMMSGFMIGGTLIVFSQLKYMNEKALGVDISDSVVIEVPDFSGQGNSYSNALYVLKSDIAALNGVEEVSFTSDMIGEEVGWRGGSFLLNNPSQRHVVFKMTVEASYLSFLKASFLAGRNFFDRSDSLSVIINEEAMHEYGFSKPEEAINQQIFFAGMDTMKVVGVIENYFQESLREPIKPTVYFRIDDEIKYLSIRHVRNDYQNFLASVQDHFESSFPDLPFNYHFLNQFLDKRHKKEAVFNDLFNAFSLIAILISFLGLLGLVYYVAIKRKKEVGIRKVLGSTVGDIIWLIYKEFAKLILFGNLIAIPLLWKFSSDWLNSFSFHLDFPWQIPIVMIGFCLIFSFIFTLTNILKLGRTNPVDVLKAE